MGAVEATESRYRQMTDEQLRDVTPQLSLRLQNGEPVEAILPEAFSAVREASRRAQNHRHFPCQIIGGAVLFENRIAEMKTGEGKTIVCHLPAYLKILQGKKVHIVTVNDYLVKRDAEFGQPIFEKLGLTVGYIQSQIDSGGSEGIRKQAYSCNITYGTNNEFGFDYLRDNMKWRVEDQVQGRLDYAIVDEVDSILIDEARTPLIISGPAHDDVSRYKWADQLAQYLTRLQSEANRESSQRIAQWGDKIPEVYAQNPKFEDAYRRFRVDPSMLSEEEAEAIGHRQYYIVQLDRKQVQITHDGVEAAQQEAKIGSFYVGVNMDRPHLIENALRARVVYECDKEYVVQNGEVIIVDEFTGRLMYGRQWSDGLHQAIEAKEGVRVKEETQTLATITIQNYFKLYKELAGMTGTALTESEEFLKIYNLEVVEIPTNRPVNRDDHNDKIYGSISAKYDAIVDEINEYHRKGRPNDPFILEGILKALSTIPELPSGALDKIRNALEQSRKTDEVTRELVEIMTDAYDTAMGDMVRGRPLLVGTTSVENSEKLSNQLTRRYGIEHEVLNAKFHEREAEIVAKAGQTHPSPQADKKSRGNVTIATNMAGRGTDIKLSLDVVNPKCKVPDDSSASTMFPTGTTKCCILCAEYDPTSRCAHCYKPALDRRFPEIGRKVCSMSPPCGLHIVGTERHEARRIDNQLRGRSGRQGDPGSSRFFLSLEDDLLKLFMPDWMLKMMERLGVREGTSLEAKSLTRGIERAQKKVEERNFSIRKSLLEWDEPLNYQRLAFYKERQQLLMGKGIQDLLWRMIEASVRDAVARFLDETYPARCISEWCRSTLELNIPAEKLRTDHISELVEIIRRNSISEARDAIQTSLGEYIDPDSPPEQWDVGGLLRWAQRAFGASLTQNQLRKMDPAQIEDWLNDAAEKHYEQVDLKPVESYLDENLSRTALVDWARVKFGIALTTGDILQLQPSDVERVILNKVRDAYHHREIEYPVEYIMQRAYGQGQIDNAYSAQIITAWANGKYRLGWSLEHVQQQTPQQIAESLLAINHDYLSDGRLDQEIDTALSTHEGEKLAEWAKDRFGPVFEPELLAGIDGDRNAHREVLLRMGRELMRYELTRLEQFVLLRIYDQAWKDHLLEMDQLKSAIQQRPIGGDQTHPQSQFAIEGRDLFNQMWERIREHVTDRIFKIRLAGEGQGEASTIARTQLRHDEATGAGYAGAAADQAAAMQAQGQQQAVETIRREMPKVGRNDPCPCGSGKKFKNCHGRTT